MPTGLRGKNESTAPSQGNGMSGRLKNSNAVTGVPGQPVTFSEDLQKTGSR